MVTTEVRERKHLPNPPKPTTTSAAVAASYHPIPYRPRFSQIEFNLMWALHTPQSLHHLHHHPSRSRRKFLRASITLRPAPIKENYNDLIQSLCHKGELESALKLLAKEQSPTQRTYEALIACCGRKSDFIHGVRVHERIVEDGSDQDPFLVTKLIGMYSELDQVEYARQVFDKTRERTVYVWNAIFRALTLAGLGEEALKLYVEMNRTGVGSDRFTYTYVLKACVATEYVSFMLEKGKEIHAHVLRHGYESRVHIMTTLVDMYARFGLVSYAERVFGSMPVRNVVSWSAMIACYAKNERPFEALKLFFRMMGERPDEDPSSVTMVSALQACAALVALEQGKLIHGYILRKGLDTILPVISVLVTMYARCGNLRLAQLVFDQVEKRDVVLWNSLISSYGIYGMGQEAIRIFNEMIRSGIRPSPISFVSVLGACSHSGLVEEGKQLFNSMGKDHGITPSVEHYACMVDLLGRANLLPEAIEIIEGMRIEPGPKVWGSLLGSCRIHTNVDLAERASKRLFRLEPYNAGNYVLLADIYAAAQMWDQVKRVKRLLDSRGLQKVPGCSWIEVRRRIHSFISTDELNPQMEQIHALLLKLSLEMKEQGYVPETKNVLYDLDTEEKEKILLGHSEKLAVAFGLINSRRGETIRITKNLRLCEDCHAVTKFVSRFASREIFVRDVNRVHRFRDGVCSCGDYW